MAATHEDFSRIHDVKASSNRNFGWVFTAAFLFIALWPLVSGHPPRWWALIVAALFLVITRFAPAFLALPKRLWLRFSRLLSRIISPIILAFIFYVIVTPLGALMRMFGQDSLRLRSNRGGESYWIKRDPPGPNPNSLNNQF
jgi:hypothetical protein